MTITHDQIPAAIINTADELMETEFKDTEQSNLIWYEFKLPHSNQRKFAFVIAKGKYKSLGALVYGIVEITTYTFQVHYDTNASSAIKWASGLHFRGSAITEPEFLCIL